MNGNGSIDQSNFVFTGPMCKIMYIFIRLACFVKYEFIFHITDEDKSIPYCQHAYDHFGGVAVNLESRA